MSNKKPDRIYNKDRIQRIKEASDKAKQSDPNWHSDAPPSILPPEDDDMPITQMRTPPFLKEKDYQNSDFEKGVTKKLTLNELTQCNKDSSQLQVIMNSSNNFINQSKNETRSINYLEMSRLKKVKERDDLNRQTAESLDKASERWHFQLKEFNKNKNTQDSTGVKSSLFNDDNNDYDKSENEKNEKRSTNRRVSSDFLNRFDLLLQRGTRHSKMFNNIGGLRRVSERSFNRWSGRFDKSSSMWDLRYPLLSNSLGGGVHSNHFTPGFGLTSFKSESKLLPHKNSINDFNNVHNMSFQYPTTLLNNNANINTSSNNNPSFQYNPTTPFQQNYNIPTFIPYTPNLNQNQLPMTNSINLPLPNNGSLSMPNMNQFNNPFEGQIQTNPSQFTQNTIWPINFPQQTFPQAYSNIPISTTNNFPSTYLSPNPTDIIPQTNSVNNIIPNSVEVNKTFESVTRKIDILAEKLEVLNLTVDQLKTVKTQNVGNSVIKTHKNINISSENENQSEENVIIKGIYRPSIAKLCNCPDCNKNQRNPSNQINSINRKVRFELLDKGISEIEVENTESLEVDTSKNTIDDPNKYLDKNQPPNYPKNSHPQLIQKQYHNNSRVSEQFQSFKLPSQLSTILQSNRRNK